MYDLTFDPLEAPKLKESQEATLKSTIFICKGKNFVV
jgi:hypothetical protein